MKQWISRWLFGVFLLAAGSPTALAQQAYNAPAAGNPLLPGYFADPTIKKFGDTYYIYATTDGNGAGFGPAQVWCSKDFVNWTLMPMNWPDSHWIWAPDVMRHADGRYYYFYCQPCTIHCGVGDTPRGPWKNILGESEAVLVPDRYVKNAITLDGQTFQDNDGAVYLYWGTWGIYEGFGCGAGQLSADLKSFTCTRLIPNTEATDFFEAPFVMKRGGTYYLLYSCDSCHDSTYHVQYATAAQPLGPYTFGGCLLETNDDGTIDGPGHTSVLQEGEDYYLVYHRHDNPHSTRGFHRQVCADRLKFDRSGNILQVQPTHKGVGALAPLTVKSPNLALGAKVSASSCYNDDFRPEYAVDDNNGTLWRAQGTGQAWIEIDLGHIQEIRTVWTQFEYGTQFYQYMIETSVDGRRWDLFADKRNNRLAGSPMVDFGRQAARYVRLTCTGGQKRGFGGAVWNIKVFPGVEDSPPQQWLGLTAADWDGRSWQNNEGMLAGAFTREEGEVQAVRLQGRDALALAPHTTLRYAHPLLSSHRPHTLAAMRYTAGTWQALAEEAGGNLQAGEGEVLVQSGDSTLVLTNLRYYNWRQEEAEQAYDAATDIPRQPVADNHTRGLVVDITADDFAVGDTARYLRDHGTGGLFLPGRIPAMIEEREGLRALHFDGRQHYRSTFSLPASLRDNAPYTIEAWVLNDTIAENECVADFTTSFDELEKLMLGNGTEPRCGVVNHYGWFEDAGYEDIGTFAGQWQHLYISFDGRMERVYINGVLISEKEIQLLLKPSQFVTLGRNSGQEWPFTGYLHALRLWDEYIPWEAQPSNN
ncbi:MAG: family 43 glycosylhydrolase [Prevotellaceae bacterium]|nr:family 43 glycosylhydrolase [Prevotellaceae bacterium]